MGTFGIEDEEIKQSEKVVSIEGKKRKAFAYWTVGETDYKLKLTTEEICRLEDKWGRGLADMATTGSSMPPLSVMLMITHAAMVPWKHGKSIKDVQQMFNSYVEEGGSQLEFYSGVIMPIMAVSGFFTESQALDMEENLERMKNEL